MSDRINCAAWIDESSGVIHLLARHINGKGGVMMPDWGGLELLSFDNNRQLVDQRIVWEGKGNELNLEDARATVSADRRVLVGLTAVVEEGEHFIPYPAFSAFKEERLENLVIAKNLGPGKNITSLTEDAWVYRKAIDDFSLTVVSWDGKTATPMGDLTLNPIPHWATEKIGTTMPPIWINEHEALFLLHGVSKIGDMYHYALGRAKLVREGRAFRISLVDPKPFLTTEDLAETSTALGIRERHEFRRVVYCCGGILQKKELSLFVNIGDSTTVEVVYPLEELTRGWW